MNKKTEKLTFFCQLCDKSIEGNICPVHGIDFVTIKKITVVEKQPQPEGQEERRVNGMLQIEQKSASKTGNGETRIAMTQPSKKDAYLPVIPTESDPNKSLEPVPPPVQEPPQAPPNFQEKTPYQENITYQQPETEVDAETQFFQPSPTYSAKDAPKDAPNFYTEQTKAYQAQPAAPAKSNKTLMIAAVSIVAIIVLAAAAYFVLDKPEASPTELYSQAETYYSNQNYTEALALYTQLIEDHPDNPLAPVVREKVKQLNQQVSQPVNIVAEDQQRIKEWMVSANLAFKSQQYLRPKDDNAVAYIKNILAIDPNYTPALEMQQNIIANFEQLAEAAVSNGLFNDGISYYQMILEIKPNDPEVLKKMRYVLEQKSALSQ